jgi:hypothetical protein
VHGGAFVWADNSTTSEYTSGGANEFRVRAAGGALIHSDAAATTGVQLPIGGGAWGAVCDRTKKENFVPVDTREILNKVTQIEVSEWNYISQEQHIRHMGPMAQDFFATFGLGESDTTITTIDPDGVLFAAVQELARQNKAQAAEIAELKHLVQQMIQIGSK